MLIRGPPRSSPSDAFYAVFRLTASLLDGATPDRDDVPRTDAMIRLPHIVQRLVEGEGGSYWEYKGLRYPPQTTQVVTGTPDKKEKGGVRWKEELADVREFSQRTMEEIRGDKELVMPGRW